MVYPAAKYNLQLSISIRNSALSTSLLTANENFKREPKWSAILYKLSRGTARSSKVQYF